MNGGVLAVTPEIYVKSRKFLTFHYPPQPSMLVLISSNGSLHRLPVRVKERYACIIEWRVSDIDIPDGSDNVMRQIMAAGKTFISVLLGHAVLPSEMETMLFVKALKDALASKEYRSITVACAAGMSRSPAVAIFIAELLGLHEEVDRLKSRYKLYNKTLYKLLRQSNECLSGACKYNQDSNQEFIVEHLKMMNLDIRCGGVR